MQETSRTLCHESSSAVLEDNSSSWPPEQMPQAASFNFSTPVVQPGSPQTEPMSSSILRNGLPSDSILKELAELFFQFVYPWAPMFHKPTFFANMFNPSRLVLLHGLVVVAFRFWPRSQPSLEEREAYVRASRERLLLEAVDSCSLQTAQALTLLAIDAVGQCPGPRTWNVMAMLIRMSQQLGLGKAASQADTKLSLVHNDDLCNDMDLSAIDQEERRRLFWTIYSLDRFSSVPYGQPCAIDSKTIKLPYPALDQEWGQRPSVQWFQGINTTRPSQSYGPVNTWKYFIDLLTFVEWSNQLLVQPLNLSLLSHCREWQSSFRRVDNTLATWFENLPINIRVPAQGFDTMSTMVHAIFHL